ncbi:MAG: prepilin-type N-terminal cleavage/methylation domain-containing protein [Kiritimatiellia bacterium]
MIKCIRQSAFTLIEMVMAIMILSIMMLLSFFCFNSVVQAWNAGIEVSDAMGQADYVMEQLVSGLRSAYYPDAGTKIDDYGFQLYDNGEEEDARDSISWVKLGNALVGEDCGFAESPHRVSVSVGGEDNEKGLQAKAWRVDLQLDEFDPAEDTVPVGLSPRVIAFNCRVLDKDQPEKNDEPNWQDEWSSSNSIPKAVELSLYMEPSENAEDDDPIEVKRIVRIPLWDISQNPREKNSAGGGSDTGTRPPQSGVIRENRPPQNRGTPESGADAGGDSNRVRPPRGGRTPPAGRSERGRRTPVPAM